MPVNDPIDPIGNARIHHGLDFGDFIGGISPVILRPDGDSNHGAFPVLGKVVDGVGIEILPPLLRPAIQGHSMQSGGNAVLINDLVSFNTEPAVRADKSLLPGALGNKAQTGQPNPGHS